MFGRRQTIDETVDGSPMIHILSTEGDLEAVTWLLTHGAHVNSLDEEGNTPLHKAVQNKHQMVMMILILYGANVDAKNKNRGTIRHLVGAAEQNSEEEEILTLLHSVSII